MIESSGAARSAGSPAVVDASAGFRVGKDDAFASREAPHLVHVFPTFETGGMELRVASLINAMGAKFRHTILPLKPPTTAASAIAPEIALRLCPPGTKPMGPLALRRLLRRLEPDLLLTYNWGSFDAIMGTALFPFCPLIHNECGFGADESAGLKWRRRLVRRMLLPHLRKTITVSRALRDLLIEDVHVPESKVRFIQTGVDTDQFSPGRRRVWRREVNIPDDALLFGSVGRLRPEKNFPFLLEAFRRAEIPNSRLVLVGEGALRASLERAAAELGIGERVFFTGFVGDPAPLFQEMDVFVMSSLTEQTPNALLQAMATGLPCVCTNVGDTAELLGDPAFVFELNDRPAYLAALKALAASAPLRFDRGAANRARCEARYSFTRMVEAYRQEYIDAVASGGRR